jgi:hypothetical protein
MSLLTGDPEQPADGTELFIPALLGTLLMAPGGLALALTPYCGNYYQSNGVEFCTAPWLVAWGKIAIFFVVLGLMGAGVGFLFPLAVMIPTGIYWFRGLRRWRDRPALFVVALLGFLLVVCLPAFGFVITVGTAWRSRGAGGL